MSPIDSDVLNAFIVFGSIAFIIFIVNYFSYRNRQAGIRVMEKLTEQGQPLTPEVMDRLMGRPHKPSYTPFGRAVFLILIGVSLALFFLAMWASIHSPPFLTAVGLFPMAIGGARLIAILYEKRLPK